MNTLPRILRLGLLIPVAFISMAGLIVAIVVTYRSWQFEKAAREAQKQAIESHVLIESAKIAEEVYLRLDNWQAREKQIATYFQGKGATTRLRFKPPSEPNSQGNESQGVMRWKTYV